MRAKKRAQKKQLVVTAEAIEDFSRLSYAERLRWLDEMRSLLGKVREATTEYSSKCYRYK